MIKYGINVDLMKRLIDKLIMSKTDIFDSYEITMDDNGNKIYIFVTVYFDNRKLETCQDCNEYFKKMKNETWRTRCGPCYYKNKNKNISVTC